MIIRPRGHWLTLALGILCLFTSYLEFHHQDHSLFFTSISLAIVYLISWLTNFTSLSHGVLTDRWLLIPLRKFPVNEIIRVELHESSKWWEYGTDIYISSSTGKKISIPARGAKKFLSALYQHAPQAEYLIEN